MNAHNRMFVEAGQSPEAVRAQLARNAAAIRELGQILRERAPRSVVTCARGSSDHAATFAKYLIEAYTGLPTSSAAPSVSSIYEARPHLRDVLFIAISQSGKSPDLIATTQNAKANGALTVALCNAPAAPLMEIVDVAIPLHAGPETSVAATKSYIASLSAIVHLVASWTQNEELSTALLGAPDRLARAWQSDWSRAVDTLQSAINLYVIARGFGLGIAQEAALKLKETCGLHAEAFSAAEVKHGPMALVRAGFPVLMFAQDDDTREGIEDLARELCARGATVMLAGADAAPALSLETIAAHPVIEPMLRIQSFYRMAEALARARGFDPDCPPHLNKVTETL